MTGKTVHLVVIAMSSESESTRTVAGSIPVEAAYLPHHGSKGEAMGKILTKRLASRRLSKYTLSGNVCILSTTAERLTSWVG